MTTLSAQPSGTSDTSKVWIPRQDALKVLAKAKESTILEERLLQKQRDIDTLTEQINIKQRIINEMSAAGEANKSIIETYKKEIEQLTGIRSLLEQERKYNARQLKKSKRKIFWRSVFGVVGTIGGLYLGATVL